MSGLWPCRAGGEGLQMLQRYTEVDNALPGSVDDLGALHLHSFDVVLIYPRLFSVTGKHVTQTLIIGMCPQIQY